MINYDKLKEAQNLCQKLEGYYFSGWFDSQGKSENYLFNPEKHNIFTGDMDGIIDKLLELTQSEPKYKAGQKLYALYEGGIKEVEVLCSDWDSETNTYRCEIVNPRLWWYEHEIYPTKSDLIDAQIKMWSDMHDQHNRQETWEEKHIKSILEFRRSECQHEPEPEQPSGFTSTPDKPRSLIGDKCRQHESDGMEYQNNDGPHYKCTKCGEFYR